MLGRVACAAREDNFDLISIATCHDSALARRRRLGKGLPVQRWQPEQASHVHLEESTQEERVCDVARRRGDVDLVGVGHEPHEGLDHQARGDGKAG